MSKHRNIQLLASNSTVLAAQTIEHALTNAKVGIIARGLASDIDPVEIGKHLAQTMGEVYVSIIGREVQDVNVPGLVIDTSIEKAVDWRNHPDLAGKMVLFVPHEVAKLQSLEQLDQVTEADLAKKLIDAALEELSSNDPADRLWSGLRKIVSAIPLRRLQDFIIAVAQSGRTDARAMVDNLWRLNLLSDERLLGPDVNITKYLEQNQSRVQQLSQLSRSERAGINAAISQAINGQGDSDQDELIQIAADMRTVAAKGDPEALKRLSMQKIEKVLKSAKSSNRKRKSEDTPATLSGRRLREAIAAVVIEGEDEEREQLRDLLEAYNLHLENAGSEPFSFDGGVLGSTVLIDRQKEDPRSLLQFLCHDSAWGGTLNSKFSAMKQAIAQASQDDAVPFDPDFTPIYDGEMSLFSVLTELSRAHDAIDEIEPILNKLRRSRRELVKHVDLLALEPLLLLGSDQSLLNILNDYISAYSGLLDFVKEHDAQFSAYDRTATNVALQHLLRLDVVLVQCGSDSKAILTPLHPVHLWRYREILISVLGKKDSLDPADRSRLTEALAELPHLLHYVVIGGLTGVGSRLILPRAGTYGTLPVYENHTNRFLGLDGLGVIKEVVERWYLEVPYTRSQLRIALIDVPDLGFALRQISEVLLQRDRNSSSAIIEVFSTRKESQQGIRSSLASLEPDGEDADVAEALESGKLVLRYRHAEPSEIATALEEQPVHIAMLFDQARFSVVSAPHAIGLIVSPLVVSYKYDLQGISSQGIITPSAEAADGLFESYDFIAQIASEAPAGERVQFSSVADQASYTSQSILRNGGAQWLVQADRSLLGVHPEGAVPLKEQVDGSREVGVWAAENSRTVAQFKQLLRRYALTTSHSRLIEIIKDFGHISRQGLLAIPVSPGPSHDSALKGLMGTVLAAAWYTSAYPGSLITTLDSGLARRWLANREDGAERADLIGLRQENGDLIVEAIEVKSRADDGDVRVVKDADKGIALAGPAVDQIRHTLDTLKSIFGLVEADPLFTPARREALRYQVYRECFRDHHDKEWRKQWFHRLNDAFSQPPKLGVRCEGIVVRMQFEDSGFVSHARDGDLAISLVSIGIDGVQRILDGGDAGEAPPNVGQSQYGELTQAEDLHADLHDTDADIKDPSSSDGITILEETSSRLGADGPEVALSPGASLTGVQTSDTLATSSSRGLQPTSEDRVRAEAVELTSAFLRAAKSFRIDIAECDHAKAVRGPRQWRLYARLGKGQRIDALRNVIEDIGREMRRGGLIVASVPNSDLVSVDIPRDDSSPIDITEAIDRLPAVRSIEQMPIAIGVTPEGEHLIRDLSTLPHLLVGGTTGSGKTIYLYGLMLGLLHQHPSPSSLQVLLCTSKPEDFVFFEGLPHLVERSVVDDAAKAIELFRSFVASTSEERKQVLMDDRSRDIAEYNRKHADTPLHPLVIVVDEFADLSDQLAGQRAAREAFYQVIRQIAQLGRSRGIHLVLCTQRPSVDLVPANIRTLLNGRVALRVNDATASRMILEEPGAERLQKHGDLLFKEESTIVRAQGYLTTTDFLDVSLKKYQ